MTRELGVICNLQAAEVLPANGNCTLGFDATTPEELHINEIHITTNMECRVIALEELPGGTAEDYEDNLRQCLLMICGGESPFSFQVFSIYTCT